MKKTLVLVVDRDDDFGVKGDVTTPVVGVEDCSVAATALGMADPEDSDINALYSAINIYKDLRKEGSDYVEVALICGDKKVGYRSDAAIIDELEEVLERVHPDRIILVGDGAEDEYVYPIISSRVPIDSVKKVFVKQAPGIEGTVYIVSKFLSDPQKRRRFLAPLGWVIILISALYLFPDLLECINGNIPLSNITTPLIVFMVGIVFALYAYNAEDVITKWYNKWIARVKRGSISVTFVIVSVFFVLMALMWGFMSLSNIYAVNVFEQIVCFVSNSLWLFIFAILIYMCSDLIDKYLSVKKIKLSFIIGSINILAIGLILTGALDVILFYLHIGLCNNLVAALELIAGFSLAFMSAFLQRHMKEALEIIDSEGEANAVQ